MQSGAQTLLLMAGQPPVMRVQGALSPPLQPEPLDWQVTQGLAEQLLPAEYRSGFEKTGSAELPFHVAGVAGNLTIFYGNGCHNLVFHLTGGNGKH
jgi:Tfp pilus assembly pilus retraction ATPase PilT